MPLVEGKWEPTTEETLKAFEESLASMREVELTPELVARLEAAFEQKVDRGPSLAMLVDGNRRFYPQLSRMLEKGQGRVDIVVPVYNAWHITRKCLDAVIERTCWPYQLIVVDDASDRYTSEQLKWFNSNDSLVIHNEKNRGFAATVNRGIRSGRGEYVCLLNSDVMVTPGWLTKMVLALEANDRNAIVCPATNNTAVVDIPMSPGASYLHMNQALEGFAQRRYPEIMPTGFCFLFRRKLLDEVGYFDEGFRDFGEETAFWWKCVRTGYRAVMADDTYVFHERASSYSALGEAKHGSYRRAASQRFNSLFPEWVEWRDAHDVKEALGPLRQPVPPALLRSPTDRYRVCWLVHDARPTGAMRFIADIANELCERGVNAKIVVLKREGTPEEWLGELRSAPVFFGSLTELIEEFPRCVFAEGLVIAGTVELAPAVQALTEASGGRLRGCLHAQSFDPALAKDPADVAHLQALYKLVPDVIAGSNWVAQEIAALGSTVFATVHPGVDRTLFYPRDRSKGDERPTVIIPMNPSVWWRGWERGLELIQELEKQADERKLDLRILVYGVDQLPIVSRAICLGVITQTRLAHLLGTEVDGLVDPSHLHSYGMPAIEAAASGVRVMTYDNRGIWEYGNDIGPTTLSNFPNAITQNAAHVLEWVQHPIPRDSGYLTNHDREKQVAAWIEAVEGHFKLLRRKLRICMVAPHLRKWGGPTTMVAIARELSRRGHRVEVATVYEDVHPSIAAWAEVPIVKGELPEGADLYITNSDNPWVERIASIIWPPNWPKEGPKPRGILLKLSHNPRFKAAEELGLQQLWHAIVTSTQWLADVCQDPLPEWKHPPRTAKVIGWWHYEHARFRCPPSERTYGDGSAERPFVIGTLIHAHPTKGTREALEAIAKLPREYHYRCIGVGEVPHRAVKLPEGWEYAFEPTRDEMAAIMKQCDFWVSASKSEGLGRLTLEAMSAGAVVVGSDTGAEHLKHGAWLIEPFDGKATSDYVSTLRDALHAVIIRPGLSDQLRAQGFATAEAAADPTNCIRALEEVIANVVQ